MCIIFLFVSLNILPNWSFNDLLVLFLQLRIRSFQVLIVLHGSFAQVFNVPHRWSQPRGGSPRSFLSPLCASCEYFVMGHLAVQ